MKNRKCNHCKGAITIERGKLDNIVRFQEGKQFYYYHSKCFVEKATEKASATKGKPQVWKEALNNIEKLEANAKDTLEHLFDKDDLNDWLLTHYNLASIPTSFWQRIEDIENGKYQGKKCKPVSAKTIFKTWEWGQDELDKINVANKTKNVGPKSDDVRIIYDLAIIVGKVPAFLAYKANKTVAVSCESNNNTNYQDVDMSKIGQKRKETKEDISDLFNDFYIE